jgi:hypothetical protein
MQKLPVYLYSNLFEVQVNLDDGIKGAYNTMYQRELKIQKGLKNKVQLQFKNADQKSVRIKGVSTNTSLVTSATFTITVASTASISVGMYPSITGDADVFQPGTYVSAVNGLNVTVSNENPAYNPELDQFLSPILKNIAQGTQITFGKNFVFNMFDSTNNHLLVTKAVEITDDGISTATRGLALLTLSENDTRDLETTYYTFGITETDSDGANLPTYSNTYYGINGQLKLTADLFPTPKPTQSITAWQKYYNNGILKYEFHSGNLRAYPEFNPVTTVAMKMTGFKGTIILQGTLENNPGTFANYATLETITYTQATTATIYKNADGLWSDVRVKWIPDSDGVTNYYSPQMPGNPTPGVEYFPNGKIDSIQYRS